MSPVIAYAQVDYRPLVEEGKRWTYDNFLSVRPEKNNHYYWYELSGDIIRDVPCPANRKSSNGTWFDLSERCLTGKPTKGIYIKDGRKVVVRYTAEEMQRDER